MADASKRELILDNVLETLQGIDQSGTFETKVDNFGEEPESLSGRIGGNWYGWMEVGDDAQAFGMHGGIPQINHSLPITIFGKFSQRKDNRNYADKVVADIDRALAADRRRGQSSGSVQTIPSGVPSPIVEKQADSVVVEVSAVYIIQWQTDFGTP